MASQVPAAIKSACCISLRKSQGSWWQPTSSNQHECGKVEGLAEESPWGTGTWIHCHLTATWGGSVLSVLNPMQTETLSPATWTGSTFSLASFAHSLSYVTPSTLHWSKLIINTESKSTHGDLFSSALSTSKGAFAWIQTGLPDIADWCSRNHSLTLWSYFGYQGILSCRRLPEELWEIGRRSSGIKTREAKSVGARPSSNGNSYFPFRPMKTSVYAKHSGEGFPHRITQQAVTGCKPWVQHVPTKNLLHCKKDHGEVRKW